jgi:hypothetical protein
MNPVTIGYQGTMNKEIALAIKGVGAPGTTHGYFSLF